MKSRSSHARFMIVHGIIPKSNSLLAIDAAIVTSGWAGGGGGVAANAPRNGRRPTRLKRKLQELRAALLSAANFSSCSLILRLFHVRETDSSRNGHSSVGFQLASGSNSVIAVAVSTVAFARSFWRRSPSWLMMKVITPELPYSAG